MADIFNIAGEINSTSQEGTAVHANQVKDDLKNKKQSQINEEVGEELELHTNRLNALTGQNYITVQATQSTTAADIPTLINASGEGEQTDTLYRVGFWDGSAYVADKYTEYAWNGTAYVILDVKSSIGEVFDISLYKAVGGVLATFADLSAALDGGNNVPAGVRQGGMSIKFVQSSNNKYVQYRCMADTWSITTSDWQGVDDEPTADSNNLVKSGGVKNSIDNLRDEIGLLENITDTIDVIKGSYQGNVLVKDIQFSGKVGDSFYITVTSNIIADGKNVFFFYNGITQDSPYFAPTKNTRDSFTAPIDFSKLVFRLDDRFILDDGDIDILIEPCAGEGTLVQEIDSIEGTLSSLVVDSLDSSDSTKALSAKQGALLNQTIEALQTEVDNVQAEVISANDKYEWSDGYIHTDGKIKTSGDAYTYYLYTKTPIPVVANSKYSISNLSHYNSLLYLDYRKEVIGVQSLTDGTNDITAPSDCMYIQVSYVKALGTNAVVMTSTLPEEVGNLSEVVSDLSEETKLSPTVIEKNYSFSAGTLFSDKIDVSKAQKVELEFSLISGTLDYVQVYKNTTNGSNFLLQYTFSGNGEPSSKLTLDVSEIDNLIVYKAAASVTSAAELSLIVSKYTDRQYESKYNTVVKPNSFIGDSMLLTDLYDGVVIDDRASYYGWDTSTKIMTRSASDTTFAYIIDIEKVIGRLYIPNYKKYQRNNYRELVITEDGLKMIAVIQAPISASDSRYGIEYDSESNDVYIDLNVIKTNYPAAKYVIIGMEYGSQVPVSLIDGFVELPLWLKGQFENSIEDSIEELSEEVEALKNIPELILPTDTVAVVGHEWNMYFDNVFQVLTEGYDVMVSFTVIPEGSTIKTNSWQFIDELRITPTVQDVGDYTIAIRLSNRKKRTGWVVEKTMTLHVITDSALSNKKVIFIGDSLTNAGVYAAEIQHNLSNGGITSLGTRTATPTIDDVQLSVNHEGRAGWGAYDYTRTVTPYRTDVENAFWNPTKGAFDFSYYMQQQGYDGVDVVCIGLGTNGLEASDAKVKNTTDALQIMIDSIREYSPTVKILIALTPPPATQDGTGKHAHLQSAADLKRAEMMQVKKYLEMWQNTSDANLDVIELYFHIDRQRDFNTVTEAASFRNPEQVTRQNNNVHPSNYGYLKFADAYYNRILWQLTK